MPVPAAIATAVDLVKALATSAAISMLSEYVVQGLTQIRGSLARERAPYWVEYELNRLGQRRDSFSPEQIQTLNQIYEDRAQMLTQVRFGQRPDSDLDVLDTLLVLMWGDATNEWAQAIYLGYMNNDWRGANAIVNRLVPPVVPPPPGEEEVDTSHWAEVEIPTDFGTVWLPMPSAASLGIYTGEDGKLHLGGEIGLADVLEYLKTNYPSVLAKMNWQYLTSQDQLSASTTLWRYNVATDDWDMFSTGLPEWARDLPWEDVLGKPIYVVRSQAEWESMQQFVIDGGITTWLDAGEDDTIIGGGPDGGQVASVALKMPALGGLQILRSEQILELFGFDTEGDLAEQFKDFIWLALENEYLPIDLSKGVQRAEDLVVFGKALKKQKIINKKLLLPSVGWDRTIAGLAKQYPVIEAILRGKGWAGWIKKGIELGMEVKKVIPFIPEDPMGALEGVRILLSNATFKPEEFAIGIDLIHAIPELINSQEFRDAIVAEVSSEEKQKLYWNLIQDKYGAKMAEALRMAIAAGVLPDADTLRINPEGGGPGKGVKVKLPIILPGLNVKLIEPPDIPSIELPDIIWGEVQESTEFERMSSSCRLRLEDWLVKKRGNGKLHAAPICLELFNSFMLRFTRAHPKYVLEEGESEAKGDE